MALDFISIIIYIVLILFILAIIAKISGQTLIEMIQSISEWLSGKGEDTAERAVEIY